MSSRVRPTVRRWLSISLSTLYLGIAPLAQADSAILEGERFHPQVGEHGMVATSH